MVTSETRLVGVQIALGMAQFWPGASNQGVGGSRTPRFWEGGHGGVAGLVVGVVDGPGREILLYLIMYWKYVRKWLLLIRNRIICPEVAVNEQFFAWKIKLINCLKKSKFFKNLPGKIEILLTRIHEPPDFKPD